jgi:hypothetical protein
LLSSAPLGLVATSRKRAPAAPPRRPQPAAEGKELRRAPEAALKAEAPKEAALKAEAPKAAALREAMRQAEEAAEKSTSEVTIILRPVRS